MIAREDTSNDLNNVVIYVDPRQYDRICRRRIERDRFLHRKGRQKPTYIPIAVRPMHSNLNYRTNNVDQIRGFQNVENPVSLNQAPQDINAGNILEVNKIPVSNSTGIPHLHQTTYGVNSNNALQTNTIPPRGVDTQWQFHSQAEANQFSQPINNSVHGTIGLDNTNYLQTFDKPTGLSNFENHYTNVSHTEHSQPSENVDSLSQYTNTQNAENLPQNTYADNQYFHQTQGTFMPKGFEGRYFQGVDNYSQFNTSEYSAMNHGVSKVSLIPSVDSNGQAHVDLSQINGGLKSDVMSKNPPSTGHNDFYLPMANQRPRTQHSSPTYSYTSDHSSSSAYDTHIDNHKLQNVKYGSLSNSGPYYGSREQFSESSNYYNGVANMDKIHNYNSHNVESGQYVHNCDLEHYSQSTDHHYPHGYTNRHQGNIPHFGQHSNDGTLQDPDKKIYKDSGLLTDTDLPTNDPGLLIVENNLGGSSYCPTSNIHQVNNFFNNTGSSVPLNNGQNTNVEKLSIGRFVSVKPISSSDVSTHINSSAVQNVSAASSASSSISGMSSRMSVDKDLANFADVATLISGDKDTYKSNSVASGSTTHSRHSEFSPESHASVGFDGFISNSPNILPTCPSQNGFYNDVYYSYFPNTVDHNVNF